jgi:hypothetical protein
MWGNALGWTISAAIVALTAAGIVWLERNLSDLTPPTEFSNHSSNLNPLEMPVPVHELIPDAGPADAADLYRQAIAEYERDSDRYDRFIVTGRSSADASDLAAVEMIIRATGSSRINLFAPMPREIVKFGDKPQLNAIRAVGKSANRAGALLSYEKNTESAIRHHRAAFALGARLLDERLILDELLAGLEMMSEASAGIAAAGGQSETANLFTEYRTSAIAYQEARIKPAQRVITSIDPGVIATHSGDVFHAARHAPERMWRVEAILKLGRLRFSAARLADQRGADRVLAELADDPDPVVRAAVDAARSLTLEEYRMLK